MSSARVNVTKISSEASRPPLAQLAKIVFRKSIATFGSGNTTTVLIGRELDRRGWLGQAQFDLCFTVARVTPGTNLLAFIAAAGWYLRGWPGAAFALTALSFPASCVAVLLTVAYETWHLHPLGKHAIEAAMASIVGVIATGAWLLVRPSIRFVRTPVIVLGAVIASRYLPPLIIVGIAVLVGYVWQKEPEQ